MKSADPVEMFRFYSKAAREARCPTCRTVSMLGMMCATAMRGGGIVAFVGRGYGSDWPKPWDESKSTAGQSGS